MNRSFAWSGDAGAPPCLVAVKHKGRFHPLRILTAHYGQENTQRGHRVVQHRHAVYHLVLYTAGTNEFLFNSRRRPSMPGTLVFTEPGVPHDFSPLCPGRTSYHEATFVLGDAPARCVLPFADMLSLLIGMPVSMESPIIVLPPAATNLLDAAYSSLLDDCERPSPTRLSRIHLSVARLLGVTAEILATPTPDSATPPPSVALERARMLIETRFQQRTPLAGMARDAGMSREHFCRAFRKAYGLPPVALQMRLRIAAAKNLLATGRLQCKDIADRLGFADTYCFSKAFRKHTHVAPSKWHSKTTMT